MGDNRVVQALGKGNIWLDIKDENDYNPATLVDVLYVPDLAKNLFSVSAAAKRGYTIELQQSGCVILDKFRKISGSGKLQRRFYTLTPISVLYVNIYSSSLRLFKTYLLVSLLSATHGPCLILVLCLLLSWLRVTFVLNTLIALKESFFRPVTWRKYLGLTSL